MKVVCISDTHGHHRSLDVPDGDILIHAGDIDYAFGNVQHLVDFNEWLGELPHKHKILIAGNHDTAFETRPLTCEAMIKNATYLKNTSTEVDGIKIFGSPHTVPFAGAFNTPPEQIKEIWNAIPQDTDIVVTHGPPAMILDKTNFGDNAGDGYLYARIREIKPKLHVFGHIHESYGVYESDFGTTFVNAAIFGYNHLNKPIEFNLTETGAS